MARDYMDLEEWGLALQDRIHIVLSIIRRFRTLVRMLTWRSQMTSSERITDVAIDARAGRCVINDVTNGIDAA